MTGRHIASGADDGFVCLLFDVLVEPMDGGSFCIHLIG